ncbi:cysteine desulfurase [Striga asiatica]|uniref:Cysteine desulfurase n=1 Tax=Striga asiatica TaxID=4170 RepID=A0A5A7RF81_STRAF|nr:cysteine desulfurase [Striga asiatica]
MFFLELRAPHAPMAQFSGSLLRDRKYLITGWWWWWFKEPYTYAPPPLQFPAAAPNIESASSSTSLLEWSRTAGAWSAGFSISERSAADSATRRRWWAQAPPLTTVAVAVALEGLVLPPLDIGRKIHIGVGEIFFSGQRNCGENGEERERIMGVERERRGWQRPWTLVLERKVKTSWIHIMKFIIRVDDDSFCH